MTMTSAFTSDEEREAFLAAPRLAVLMSTRRDGRAVGLPVWFEWTGTVANMFAAVDSMKVRRLRRDARASLVVTNHVGEREAWVAFDGDVSIDPASGVELAVRLAGRYWDLDDPLRRAELDGWQQVPEAFCQLTLTPTEIRTGR
jgi:hypothetical protein